MRAILLLAFACAHTPAKPPPPPPPAAPSTAAERGDLAVQFVGAVAARDRKAEESLVDVRGFCGAALAAKPDAYASVDACADAVGKSNATVYPIYEQQVPAGATAGAVTESPLDASQGIYVESVDVTGTPVGVIVIDFQGHLYVVFPVKKGD